MKSKKRKKLDVLYRKKNKRKDANSTYDILSEIRINDKIRTISGMKKQFPSLPKVFKG